MKPTPCLLLTLAFAAPIVARAAEPAASGSAPPSRPPTPAIVSLELQPAELTLEDARDARTALVWGLTESGERIDLTSQAKFESASGNVAVDAANYVSPKASGSGAALVSAAGRQAKLPVEVKSVGSSPIRFVREIQPILSKVGCNAGACHGAAKGKNGFKLSLRGYDPDFDYAALTSDLSGRRFNRVAPDESLMLLKPTGSVPHEGGPVLKADSRHYKLIRQWIAEGTKHEEAAPARVRSVEVLPREINIALPGMTQRVLVLAHYPDGSTRDVTREAVMTCNNTETGLMKDNELTALRRGEGAVLVKYEGSFATAPFAVMGDRTGYAWVDHETFNFIDERVDAKLKKLKSVPSELCGDAEFVRRVWLDLAGMPPSPQAARAFVEDPAPSREKREKLVDKLLGGDEYVEFWTNKWADLLQCNGERLGEKGVWLYREWIRQSIARNVPYNEFVRGLLSAEGSVYKNPAANYFRVLEEPGKMVEDVSQTFLGVRFNCAKCHDHPFEQWTQNQYYQFGAYFSRVGIKNGQLPGEKVIFRRYDGAEVQHPKTGKNVAPLVPYGKVPDELKDAPRIEQIVQWLTSPENPYFARAAANRVWSYFFGRGIIEPVDDIRSSNPPSNPELLDALTQQFVKDGFDLRRLMRTICLSRTYQTSINPNRWNEDDVANFSHMQPRRLTAEQMLDAIDVATGSRPQLKGLPEGMRATQAPDGMVKGDTFLTLFGRPERKSSCECERTSNLSLSHALNLINGTTIDEAIAAPGNRIAKLVETEKDDRKVIEEIYYAALGRAPTDRELQGVNLAGASRLESAQDLAWALMNSPAFLFNR